MFVTFVQLPLKHRPGKLGEIARVLAGAGVNIRALSVDKTGARLLTDDPAKAMRSLEKAGHRPERLEAFDLGLTDRPGQLAQLGEELGRAEINIEMVFGVAGHDGGHLYLRVDDPEAARPVFDSISTD